MIVEFFGIVTGLARIAVILGTIGAVAEVLAAYVRKQQAAAWM